VSAPITEERTSIAIMFVDVVGSTRLTAADEAGALPALREVLDELSDQVAVHGGRSVNRRGDGALVAFADTGSAMRCAVAFQTRTAALNESRADDRAIHCRIGLHYGDATEADGTLLGAAVNIAARIEHTAEPGMALVSDAARAAAIDPPPMSDAGFHQLKGVPTPVRLWRLARPTADPQALVAGQAQAAPGDLGDGRPTIAVLAFEHPADDAAKAYLAEGVAEDVIVGLTRIRWLFVLSRHSSLNYRKPGADLKQVRADLGVRYVVQGKLIVADDRLRLSVSLSDCVAGDTVWAQRFDGALADIFTIQDQITTTIVGALEPAVIRREQEDAVRPSPRTLKHWDLFARGRWHFWQLSYRNVAIAHEILTQALALKADDPPTLSLLAYTHFAKLWSNWAKNPAASLAQAQQLALRAVRLDPDDAFAHYAYGVALSLTGSLDLATAEQERALELNPNFAGALGEIGRYLAFSGEYEPALAYLDRAIHISPGDAHLFLWFRDKGIAAFNTDRFDEAVAFARESAARRPEIFFNHYLLAAGLAAKGEPEAAKRAFADGKRLVPIYPMETMKMGHPFQRPADLDRFVAALRSCGWDG
jgi:TolB-like protein/class 3 adenylate cyclase